MICGAGTAILSASGSGGTLNWYSDSGLSTLVNTGPSYSPTVDGTTTYYVTETSAAGCVSTASPVTATVNFPATASAGGNQTICSIGSTAGLGRYGEWQRHGWHVVNFGLGLILAGRDHA